MPKISVYEALAYPVSGIVAHQSSLKGGEYLNIPYFEDWGIEERKRLENSSKFETVDFKFRYLPAS